MCRVKIPVFRVLRFICEYVYAHTRNSSISTYRYANIYLCADTLAHTHICAYACVHMFIHIYARVNVCLWKLSIGQVLKAWTPFGKDAPYKHGCRACAGTEHFQMQTLLCTYAYVYTHAYNVYANIYVCAVCAVQWHISIYARAHAYIIMHFIGILAGPRARLCHNYLNVFSMPCT